MKYFDLQRVRLGLFSRPRSEHNQISKVYKKKAIFFGSNAIVYTYRNIRTTYKRTKLTSKPLVEQKERSGASFSRSRLNVFRILECNVDKFKYKTTFWTFTFNPEQVGDVTQLSIANKYFITFRKELNRRLGYNSQYLAVPEFQKNGNVHYHVVFFNLPFIEPNFETFYKNPHLEKYKSLDFAMNDVWIYGYTYPRVLSGVKYISKYIAKYMSKAFSDNLGNRVFGQKLYFTSYGLFRPITTYDEHDIDKFLESDNIHIEAVSTYENLGLQILNIKHKSNESNIT